MQPNVTPAGIVAGLLLMLIGMPALLAMIATLAGNSMSRESIVAAGLVGSAAYLLVASPYFHLL